MSARILIVDDEVRHRELYSKVLAQAGFETAVAASFQEALGMIREAVPVLVVSDVRMPGADGIQLLRMVRDAYPAIPFLLVTAYADVGDAVTALKLGAVDYLAKPVDLDELLAAVRDVVGVRAGYEDLRVPAEAMEGIVAESPAMRAVVKDAYRVVASDANVLITGESGSGKEVVALFIHHNSLRRDGPMVAVNCAAIPATLLASELFGHERGASTGAIARRQGRFREAHGGTLFLDEVGDIPLELQGALLRAIETGRMTPVGSDREAEVDYRLLAATNHDLIQEVEGAGSDIRRGISSMGADMLLVLPGTTTSGVLASVQGES
ncbi:MAG: sigma-54-dependent transcriptional regulator [Thermodesulfobacteriota bacterium]